MTPKAPIWVWLSLLVCAGLSLVSISYRHRVESANKAVAIVAESDQILALGSAQRLTFGESLALLKGRGLTGVVIGEQTVGELLSASRILMVSVGVEAAIRGERKELERIHRGLTNRFGMDAVSIDTTLDAPTLRTTIEPDLVRATAVGIDPSQAAIARDAKLEIVVRHGNPLGSDVRYIDQTISWSKELGARYFLPTGDQLLGRRDNVKATLDALERAQMAYASPEFAKIGGDANAIAMRPDLTVRLHAAQTQEMDKLTLSGAVERYAKAAMERGIRILLIRPLTPSAEKPLGAFGDLINAIGKQVKKEGAELKPARPYKDSEVPRPLYVLIGLSLAPLVWFVISAFGASPRVALGSAALTAALGLACWVDPGRSLAALLGATIMPLAAIALQPSIKWRHPIAQFIALSAISLVGGLLVSGLLNELKYFVRADQFTGVKLAHFAPIGLIGVFYFLKFADAKRLWRSPILWSQMGLGLVILVGMAYMATRTGNDNPAGVSGIELQIRSLLEQLFVVRPRTKEFMIGHPAMVFGLGLLLMVQAKPELKDKWGGWAALALTVGAIGQTSVVNTMCHLHTPVSIGLARIAVGLIVGGIAGWVAWAALGRRIAKSEGT